MARRLRSSRSAAFVRSFSSSNLARAGLAGFASMIGTACLVGCGGDTIDTGNLFTVSDASFDAQPTSEKDAGIADGGKDSGTRDAGAQGGCATGLLSCDFAGSATSSDAGDAGDAGPTPDVHASAVTDAGDASDLVTVCIDPSSDVNNCGGCGVACVSDGNNVATAACKDSACVVGTCTAGYGDCNGLGSDGCESHLADDPANCGGCGVACPSGNICTDSACVDPLTPYGNGQDGSETVTSGTTTVAQVATPIASGTAGQSSVNVGSVTGIAKGDVVLLVQMQGPSSGGATDIVAGNYERNAVASVNGSTVTFVNPLAHSYSSTAPATAQLVVVLQYTDVTVAPAATLTAPAWNGSTGGILAFEVSGTASSPGVIDMSGKGFRGTSHATTCTATGGARYNCASGMQGESPSGNGAMATTANGSGGGGGGAGSDCGEGAGGAYGTVGSAGGAAEPASLTTSCGGAVASSGTGGAIVGAADLSTSMLMGSAGGEGGADEDGSYPGAGGNGGGIVWIAASTLKMGILLNTTIGDIRANGAAGTNGSNTTTCGSTAGGGLGSYGEGGGGGGAGGAIRIIAGTASLGNNLVMANGGAGGMCSGTTLGKTTPVAGTGGSGRIGVSVGTLTGSTTPAYDAH